MEIGAVSDIVYNVNNTDTDYKVEFNDTYSLDDIIDAKPLSLQSNESIFSMNFIDSPIASPLSSSDEASYDLDDLLDAASPEDVLSSKIESSSVPLAEHMYAAPAMETDLCLAEFSPVSVDSGISSSDDSSLADDFLDQFFSDAADVPAVEQPADDTTVDLSTICPEIFATQHNNTSPEYHALKENSYPSNSGCVDTIRFSPYRKKTPEQKLRKKAQNRSAATKYRSKKKSEFDLIFAESDALEVKNSELREKVGGLKIEIDYLKNLMLDVIKARLGNGKQVEGDNTVLSSLEYCIS